LLCSSSKKVLIENATMAKMYCYAYPLGTAKLISKSGFFPRLLLSAERLALGPLVMSNNE
jgi:hypothetical protein